MNPHDTLAKRAFTCKQPNLQMVKPEIISRRYIRVGEMPNIIN